MAGIPALLYVGATLIGFNFGGNFALFPAITADTFGTQSVGKNYPFVFLSYGVGGIADPILGGVLGDMGNSPLAFTICGIACLVGAVCTGLVKTPHHKQQDIERKQKGGIAASRLFFIQKTVPLNVPASLPPDFLQQQVGLFLLPSALEIQLSGLLQIDFIGFPLDELSTGRSRQPPFIADGGKFFRGLQELRYLLLS
ncbi:MAG: MFS transporter [Spirochaetes bacterium]|nr:MFS transporter [Spirochaetota bacterium]